MHKNSWLFLAIWFSFGTLREAYRFFSQLEKLSAQTNWVTVVDILFLIFGFTMAIYSWVSYAKAAKNDKAKKEDPSSSENV